MCIHQARWEERCCWLKSVFDTRKGKKRKRREWIRPFTKVVALWLNPTVGGLETLTPPPPPLLLNTFGTSQLAFKQSCRKEPEDGEETKYAQKGGMLWIAGCPWPGTALHLQLIVLGPTMLYKPITVWILPIKSERLMLTNACPGFYSRLIPHGASLMLHAVKVFAITLTDRNTFLHLALVSANTPSQLHDVVLFAI